MNPGRRVFITGGASGLGRALALKCAERGERVCIGDIHRAHLAQTEAELSSMGEALALPCDVTQDGDLWAAAAELEERWGGVDIVYNNAGVAHAGPLESTSLEDWNWALEINLLGVVRGCKAFLPGFKRQGHGHFVNMASMAALLELPYMSVYNVSKAGVVKLSETLKLEFERDNIQVSVVCPYFVKTRLTESMRAPQSLIQVVEKHFERSSQTAEEVADYILEAVDRQRFWIIPHARERYLWYLKCCLPGPLYQWTVKNLFPRRSSAR